MQSFLYLTLITYMYFHVFFLFAHENIINQNMLTLRFWLLLVLAFYLGRKIIHWIIRKWTSQERNSKKFTDGNVSATFKCNRDDRFNITGMCVFRKKLKRNAYIFEIIRNCIFVIFLKKKKAFCSKFTVVCVGGGEEFIFTLKYYVLLYYYCYIRAVRVDSACCNRNDVTDDKNCESMDVRVQINRLENKVDELQNKITIMEAEKLKCNSYNTFLYVI